MLKTVLVIFLCIIVLALIFLPKILSTNKGKDFLTEELSHLLPGSWSMESLQLSWIGKQKMQGVHWQTDDKAISFEAKELELNKSLWQLFFHENSQELFLKQGVLSFQNKDQPTLHFASMNLQLSPSVITLSKPAVIKLKQAEKEDIEIDLHRCAIPIQKSPLQINQIDCSLTAKGASKPIVSALASLFEINQKIDLLLSMLGPKCAVDLSLQPSSQASLSTIDVKCTYSQWHLNGLITRERLTLTEPLTGEMQINPEISQKLLKLINPLLATAIGSDHPLRLSIAPEGFSIPLAPFDLYNVEIDKATLDFGSIYLKKSGLTDSLLKLISPKLSQERMVKLTISPFDLALKDEVISSQTMSGVLADRFLITSSGLINLKTDQIDMVLNLPAETLKQIVGLKKLPSDYLFTIPLTGTIGHVEINWDEATKKLASLIMQNQKDSLLKSFLKNFSSL